MSTTVLNRLRAENKRLRRRLAEAEETLEAIRTGVVDAPVVSRPEGPGVYALSGSETPYRHFVEAMGEGAVTLAPDGSVAYANQRFALMVRTPLDRVLSAPILRFVGPSSERTFPAALARCLDVARSGESPAWTAGEFTLRAADNTMIPIFASLTALPMGEQTGVAAVFTDITERKQAEEALRTFNATLGRRVAERTQELADANETIQAQNKELGAANEELRVANESLREEIAAREAAEAALAEAKEHYRTVADFAYDWEYWRAPDGGFLYVSPAAQRITGYAAGEFAADPGLFLRIVHRGDRRRVRTHIQEAENTGRATELEFRIVRRDGAECWIHHVCQAVLTDDGRLLGRRASNRDVTGQKQAEETLAQQRAMLGAVIESSEGPVFSVDRDCRYTSFNARHARAMKALFGADIEIGRSLLDCHTNPGDRASAQANIDRALRGESVTVEAYAGEEARTRRYFEIEHSPVRDSRGEVTGVAVFARDLTERKRAEEKLHRENREVALANRILRVFVEETGDDLFDKALSAVMEDTGSRAGVFGYVDEQGNLVCPSLTRMLGECEVEGKCIVYPPEKRKGLWSRALAEKRALYTNVPPPVPPGHPIIRNNLATPIVLQDRAIGLLNLANKEADYTEEDRGFMEAIAGRIAPVLYAWIEQRLREDEREQAEAERERLLEEAETQRARLVAVLRQMPAGVAIADAQTGRILLGNQRLADIWRTSGGPDTLDEYAAHCKVLRPDGCPCEDEERPAFRAVRQGASVHNEEMDILRADGTTGSVVMSAAPIRDPAGRIVAAVVTLHDITDLKHLQRELATANTDLERRVAQRTEQLATANDALRAANEALRESEERFAAFMRHVPGAAFIKDADGRYVFANEYFRNAFHWDPAQAVGRPDTDVFPPDLAAHFRADDQRVLATGQSHEIVEVVPVDGAETTYLTHKFPIPREGQPPLVGGISLDISDLKRLEREIVDIGQRTARRIGQDLHDTLGQHLTGMVFVTEALERKLEKQGLGEAADAARLGQLIGQAIRDTRALSRGLCPVQVEADGLMSALADFAESVADRSRIDCRFQCPTPVLLADTDAATHLFHIAQEAVNNALRHAQPSQIRIGLAARGGEAALIVEDNGLGFQPDQPRTNKLGLHLMGYRASMIGGSLDVQSAPGRGTVVTCHFPHPFRRDPEEART